jgi:hypothetical protein
MPEIKIKIHGNSERHGTGRSESRSSCIFLTSRKISIQLNPDTNRNIGEEDHLAGWSFSCL